MIVEALVIALISRPFSRAPVGERAECTAGLDHAGDLSQTSLVPVCAVVIGCVVYPVVKFVTVYSVYDLYPPCS